MIRILSVNTSGQKGTVKHPVPYINLGDIGIDGDAHAGNGHRQVSLLGIEGVRAFERQSGRSFRHGAFAENITIEGYPLHTAKPGDRLRCGKVELEITQIGKKCHGAGCAVFTHTGNCVMPKEGVFARVLHGGRLSAEDRFQYIPKSYTITVITLSTRASEGVYADESGPELIRLLQAFCKEVQWTHQITYHLIPDHAAVLKSLIEQSVCQKTDIIFTAGGTGIGPSDITPETVKPLLQKELPGVMEHIRQKYGATHPAALLSRSIAGLSGESLIFTLPGSVKAVREYFSEIRKNLEHLVSMRMGTGH